MVSESANAQCGACVSTCNTSQLTRLGVGGGKFDYVVALAGNPNTGKSTIFNELTGLRQHVGNWAGKTVSRAEGAFSLDGKKFKLVDLPGTYSLLSTSVDEEIARDFVLFARPDVTIIVVDAVRLERNLNLVLQILEITDRAVVALNLIDEAERHDLKIDERKLARDLGVPVVPTAARRGRGMTELLDAVDRVATGKFKTRPHRIKYGDEKLELAIESLAAQLKTEFDDLPNARWVALRLLEEDESIIEAVKKGWIGKPAAANARSPLVAIEAR
ncbi:MAG: 50S ribosome-binding GTPase [Acidobacteria bacterium]|nr:50S ribosome-binding GTPase [Acidobacteriota bacterium]MCA1608621.1 50S ribosome-binding GTPase [Acidobacteriota bacterium]